VTTSDQGFCSGLAAGAGPSGAQAVGIGSRLDDVGVEGEPVDDGGHQAGVGDDGAHSLNGRFEAVATEARSSRSVRIWKRSSDPRASSCT